MPSVHTVKHSYKRHNPRHISSLPTFPSSNIRPNDDDITISRSRSSVAAAAAMDTAAAAAVVVVVVAVATEAGWTTPLHKMSSPTRGTLRGSLCADGFPWCSSCFLSPCVSLAQVFLTSCGCPSFPVAIRFESRNGGRNH